MTAVLLLGSPLSGAFAAEAGDDPDAGGTSRETFTSSECLRQLRAIERANDREVDRRICSAMITITESSVQTATVGDMEAWAHEQELTASETSALVAAAVAGGIKYRNWTHTYWGGSLVEKHSGRTYWDGIRAWVATYRGYTGAHSCHTEGSFGVGWAVKPINCTKPGAGSSADAVYRFDASVGVQGSPITLGIGLHYSTTAKGVSTGWQVGG